MSKTHHYQSACRANQTNIHHRRQLSFPGLTGEELFQSAGAPRRTEDPQALELSLLCTQGQQHRIDAVQIIAPGKADGHGRAGHANVFTSNISKPLQADSTGSSYIMIYCTSSYVLPFFSFVLSCKRSQMQGSSHIGSQSPNRCRGPFAQVPVARALDQRERRRHQEGT